MVFLTKKKYVESPRKVSKKKRKRVKRKMKKKARSTVNDTVGVGGGRILEVNGFY